MFNDPPSNVTLPPLEVSFSHEMEMVFELELVMTVAP
jgi:hypothetical protein